MSNLTGKVALVTGASKGIGAGIAREPAAAGAAVVVNYARDRTGAEAVVADLLRLRGQAAGAVKHPTRQRATNRESRGVRFASVGVRSPRFIQVEGRCAGLPRARRGCDGPFVAR